MFSPTVAFDLPHAGHVRLLKWAATYGELVVGLNSDASVARLKGPGRPLMGEEDRRRILQALRCVSRVVVFDEDTPEELIRQIKPNILVKGPDYAGREIAGQAFVESYGGQVITPDWLISTSTTSLIKKCQALPKPE